MAFRRKNTRCQRFFLSQCELSTIFSGNQNLKQFSFKRIRQISEKFKASLNFITSYLKCSCNLNRFQAILRHATLPREYFSCLCSLRTVYVITVRKNHTIVKQKSAVAVSGKSKWNRNRRNMKSKNASILSSAFIFFFYQYKYLYFECTMYANDNNR